MTKHWLIGWTLVFSLASTVRAHPGPRIWVSIDNGKVTTYEGPYPPSDPSNYSPEWVFSQPLGDQGDDVWAAEFPGFQIVPGGYIPVGTVFTYNIVGPLLWISPSTVEHCSFFAPAWESFANDPPIPQLAVTNELFQTKFTANGFVTGDAAFAYNGAAGDHNHLTYTLLGDGENAGGGEDGIYVLALQLAAPGATTSNTIFLLLGKNASQEELELAEDVVQYPRVHPDLDCDGDVDSQDLLQFETCLLGPGQGLSLDSQCRRADADDNNQIDLHEFALFQRCYSGIDAPALQSCMDNP